ncbi:hypothetical protein [Streptomyces sp. KR80]|uniref:hypothetical protein n=1 Tax=Streptomyces sp. KR80 TaxID=3457426 RepID=UPI003FD0C59F
MSGLETFDPSPAAAGYILGDTAIQVTVTIENGTDRPVDTDLTRVEARDDGGAKLEEIIDPSKAWARRSRRHVNLTARSSAVGFCLPDRAGDSVDFEVTPGFLDYRSATWSGSISRS